jgi:ADP-ribosyl-[dinitrogen reductase] hydrolase
MGLAVGDALGAPSEFKPLQYNKIILNDMVNQDNRFGLKAGQWTDDTSMALCLCDSLLIKKKFDPIDCMLRYINWWYNGYNNATSFDFKTTNHQSVGLGGNISLSFNKFMINGEKYTTAGDNKTSGNGSIMRLAPVAIAYHKDINKGEKIARGSSYVTHRGDEAAECCALLAYLLIYGINTGDKSILDDLGNKFKSPLFSVQCLASSASEGKDMDRNWNWKDPNYRYSPTRSSKQPEYIGSYSMDGLAMALHCFYTTNDYSSCVLKAVNLCGDADTVGAIAGQLAGAYYGVSNIPQKWIDCVMRWDGDGTIAYRASKLYKNLK